MLEEFELRNSIRELAARMTALEQQQVILNQAIQKLTDVLIERLPLEPKEAPVEDRGRCLLCMGTGIKPDSQWCSCLMGRDLKRVSTQQDGLTWLDTTGPL